MENPPTLSWLSTGKYYLKMRWNFPMASLFVDPGASKKCHRFEVTVWCPIIGGKNELLRIAHLTCLKKGHQQNCQVSIFFPNHFCSNRWALSNLPFMQRKVDAADKCPPHHAVYGLGWLVGGSWIGSILNSCANYLSKWRNVPEKGDQFVKEMNHKELIFIFQLHQFSGALAIKSISFSGDGHMLPYYVVPKAKKSCWIHSWCPKPLPKRTKGMHGCFNWLIANLYHGKMVV